MKFNQIKWIIINSNSIFHDSKPRNSETDQFLCCISCQLFFEKHKTIIYFNLFRFFVNKEMRILKSNCYIVVEFSLIACLVVSFMFLLLFSSMIHRWKLFFVFSLFLSASLLFFCSLLLGDRSTQSLLRQFLLLFNFWNSFSEMIFSRVKFQLFKIQRDYFEFFNDNSC